MKRVEMPKTATAKRFLRKKLYKSGKSWVVAGAVWATAMAFGGQVVSADATSVVSSEATNVTSSAAGVSVAQSVVLSQTSTSVITASVTTSSVSMSSSAVSSSVAVSSNTSRQDSSVISSQASETVRPSAVSSDSVTPSISASVSVAAKASSSSQSISVPAQSTSEKPASSAEVVIDVPAGSSLASGQLASLSASARASHQIVTVTQKLATTPITASSAVSNDATSLSKQIQYDEQTASSYYSQLVSLASNQPALTSTVSQANSVLGQLNGVTTSLAAAMAAASSAYALQNSAAFSSAVSTLTNLSSAISLDTAKMGALANGAGTVLNVANASSAAADTKNALNSTAISNLFGAFTGGGFFSNLTNMVTALGAAGSVANLQSSLASVASQLQVAQSAVANASNAGALSTAMKSVSAAASMTNSLYTAVASAANTAGNVMPSDFVQSSAAVQLYQQANAISAAITAASSAVDQLNAWQTLLGPVSASAGSYYRSIAAAYSQAQSNLAELQSLGSAFAQNESAIMASGAKAKDITSLMSLTNSQSAAAVADSSAALSAVAVGQAAASSALTVLQSAAHTNIADQQTVLTNQSLRTSTAIKQLQSMVAAIPTNQSLAHDLADAKSQVAVITSAVNALKSNDALVDTAAPGNLATLVNNALLQVTQATGAADAATADAQWITAKLTTTNRPGSQVTEQVMVKQATTASFSQTDQTLTVSGYQLTVAVNGKTYPSLAKAIAANPAIEQQDMTFQVAYTPETQKATVTIVDATTGKTLNTVNLTGSTATAIDFDNVAQLVNQYGTAHYLVMTDPTTAGATFDSDTATTQTYQVVLRHAVGSATASQTYTNTVTYTGAGTQTPSDAVTSAVVTTTSPIDLVTSSVITTTDAKSYGDDYFAPVATADGATIDNAGQLVFAPVTTPTVAGYQADTMTVTGKIKLGQATTAVQQVTYVPTTQRIVVTLIDDTTGQTLGTVTVTGSSNGMPNWQAVQTKQADLVTAGLQALPANDQVLQGQTFDTDNAIDQQITLHFVHGVTMASVKKQLTNTIHYTGAGANTPADKTQAVTVTKTYAVDQYTGEPISATAASQYPDYQAPTYAVSDATATVSEDGQVTFTSVTTPDVAGYAPNLTAVTGETTFDQGDTSTTVSYASLARTVAVIIKDAVTGDVLQTVTLAGQAGSPLDKTPATQAIADLTNRGYTVTDNGLTTAPTVMPTEVMSPIVVTLGHQQHEATKSVTLTHTVVYQTADGTTKAPTATQTAIVTRHVMVDDVTGDEDGTTVTYTVTGDGTVDAATGQVAFASIDTPTLAGYTANHKTVTATATMTSPTKHDVVVYTPTTQTATVTIVDATTGAKLTTMTLTGSSNSTVPTDAVQTYLDKLKAAGYNVTDALTPLLQQTFDTDDIVDQPYMLTVTHHVSQQSETRTSTNTIKYIGAPTVIDPVTQTVDVTRTYSVDDVTGREIQATDADKYGTAYQAEHFTGSNDAVATVDGTTGVITYQTIPTKPQAGYTAKPDRIDAVATFDNLNVNEVVQYDAKPQRAQITFTDAMADNRVITTVYLKGETGGAMDQAEVQAQIAALEKAGYVLVTNAFPTTAIFDAQDDGDGVPSQLYEIVLKHGVTTTTDTKPISSTIIYQGTTTKVPDKVVSAEVTKTQSVDAVTGDEILPADAAKYDGYQAPKYALAAASVDAQTGAVTFAPVTTPSMPGYTGNPTQVTATASFDNPTTTAVVTYTPAEQTALVTIHDETTGKDLPAINLAGKTGDTISFATVEQALQAYVKKGYEVVSDQDLVAGTLFTPATDDQQTFQVTLRHATKPETTPIDMTNTINYQGVTLPTTTQRVTVTRTDTRDLVTNQVVASTYTVPADAPVTIDEATGAVTFAQVDSPAVAGYTASQQSVHQQVTVQQPVANNTVVYTPDMQTVIVHYEDVNGDKTVATVTINGRSDAKIDTATANKTLANLKAAGYVIVDAGDWPATYDTDDATPQQVTVRLDHGTTTQQSSYPVHYTVNAVTAPNGQPVVVATQTATVTKTVVVDAVTKAVLTDQAPTYAITGDATIATDGTVTFKTVNVPAKPGYTVTQSTVNGQLTPQQQAGQTTVTYEPDVQVTHVIVRDAVTGETLTSYPVSGVTDATVPLTSLPDVVAKYVTAGYVAPDALPSQVAFGATGAADVVVTLAHGSAVQVTQHKVTNTVHYVNAPTALADVIQSAVVTKTIVVDAVTGQQTAQATYQTTGATVDAKTGVVTFPRVTTPAQPGYTPNQRQVTGQASYDADGLEQVTYTADQQRIHVVYVDDDAHGAVVQHGTDVIGRSDEDVYFQPIELANYDIASVDMQDAQGFDHDDDHDQTITIHLTHDVGTVVVAVNRNVSYQTSNSYPAPKQVTQQVTLHGQMDLITGQVTWQPVTVGAVDTPAMTGFTADQRQVAAVTITSPKDVQDVTVHYTPQQQQAHVVYVDDDQGGRIVQTGPTITGLGGSHATVKPVGVPHYHVINEIGGIDFDYDTTTDQTIVVHLGHDHRLVTTTVQRPIHYVDQHGHQLVPDTVQATVLTGDEDLVTQVITWLPSELLAEATPVVAGYQTSMTEVATVAVTMPGDLPAVTVVYQPIPVTTVQPKRPVKQQAVVKHVPAKSVVRPVATEKTKHAVAPAPVPVAVAQPTQAVVTTSSAPAMPVITAVKRPLVTSEANPVSAATLPETGFEQEYWLTIAGLLGLLATAGVVLKKVL
ncbi:KxYKxGKxW signal peptide domain-containing protein [Weissella cibaria]|uniref:mucin-binding protein n=2 Tax=Weissella cibaria TaxID=137591 RepID=UPI002307E411|nr:KxYKxGKxW signal peptide domain-containing protein [Weissella cibaria]WCE25137.1 KxYKxGKxW signal peptide domain-containing protein [Weissella cibaria]WCE27325.1 KxYKxGKxW signal peptide domain-containing protein [Weissella cibaria]